MNLPLFSTRAVAPVAAIVATTVACSDLTIPTQQCSTDGGVDVSLSDASLDGAGLQPFSFFVTSQRGLLAVSGCSQGFGGDLRMGFTGPGAGLRGADHICAVLAERSMPGASRKPWRAFLSVTNRGDGLPEHAINRIGAGPWYDRTGRLVANNRSELTSARPASAHPAILNDLPNEDGVPNHAPDPSVGAVDNHHVLTGSNEQGRLYGPSSTCLDWTSARGDTGTEGRPRVGLSWPRSNGRSNASNWISALDASGCAPGINIAETGGPDPSVPTVGSGGGYGAFYCFALSP